MSETGEAAMMSAIDEIERNLPPDFEANCSSILARIEAGEVMAVGYIADQLGIPFEFFGAMLESFSRAVLGVPMVADFDSHQTIH